jgi:hypothetical protein
MRRAALMTLAAAALMACGGPTTPAAPTTVTVTVTAPAATPPAGPAAAAPQASWIMPDLVGSGLQDAQDTIQRLTGYGIAVTTSHDATGAGRMQVSDRNWKVCSQSVAPGERITSSTIIDFGAVKLDENC